MSAATIQRAVFLGGLSLLFSAATSIGFLFTGSYLVLLLAIGFFVIGATSVISLILRRRSLVKLYEGGMHFRTFELTWEEIDSVEWILEEKARRLQINGKGTALLLPGSIEDIEGLSSALHKGMDLVVKDRHMNGIK